MDVFSTLKAMPNKLLNKDGSITDFKGNIISPADPNLAEVYERSKSIANKFLNSEDEVKTYAEISVEIFEVVDVLPEIGEKNKIYLVPSENGMFDEYFYNPNEKWDKIGEVKIDLSNYPNKQEVADAIAANSTADREYTNEEIGKLTKTYLWDGYGETLITILNNIIKNEETAMLCYDGYFPSGGHTVAQLLLKYDKLSLTDGGHAYSMITNNAEKYDISTDGIRISLNIFRLFYTCENGKIVSANDIEFKEGITNSSILPKYLSTDNVKGVNFIPTENMHPATKKYVDDMIKSNITNILGGEY